MAQFLHSGFWGLLGGSALIAGAAVGYLVTLPQRLVGAIMAAGAGVLISALSFDLMDEAYRRGGVDSTAIGFLAGTGAYTIANLIIARGGQSIVSALAQTQMPHCHQLLGARDLLSPSARC